MEAKVRNHDSTRGIQTNPLRVVFIVCAGEVRHALPTTHIAHFICHNISNVEIPSDSYLALLDDVS
jgi:hypothetical protein